MPAWLSAALVALWELIKPYVIPAAAAVTGAELQKGAQAQETLDKIEEADEAVAAARGWSTADRLRFIEQRGRLRGVDKV